MWVIPITFQIPSCTTIANMIPLDARTNSGSVDSIRKPQQITCPWTSRMEGYSRLVKNGGRAITGPKFANTILDTKRENMPHKDARKKDALVTSNLASETIKIKYPT